MDFNAVWMFVKVVQVGSFSGAAKQIGIPKSTVSKRLAELEEQLQVTLLTRTTRKLQLTEVGHRYYETCSRAFLELQEAQTETTFAQSQVKGLLKVTAPAEISSSLMATLVSDFMAAYPEVEVELVLSDRVLDFLGDGIDVAIRAGELDDSSLMARRVGTSQFQIFASPKYLKTHGSPKIPNELKSHNCFRFTGPSEGRVWDLRSKGKKARVTISGAFSANSLNTLKALAVSGKGITLIPTMTCQTEVKSGALVRILPEWAAEDSPLHLVYPKQKYMAPKLSAFIPFAMSRLSQMLSFDD